MDVCRNCGADRSPESLMGGLCETCQRYKAEAGKVIIQRLLIRGREIILWNSVGREAAAFRVVKKRRARALARRYECPVEIVERDERDDEENDRVVFRVEGAPLLEPPAE